MEEEYLAVAVVLENWSIMILDDQEYYFQVEEKVLAVRRESDGFLHAVFPEGHWIRAHYLSLEDARELRESNVKGKKNGSTND